VITKTVDLSEIRDLDISEVTMRAVNGDDAVEAASRCVPPDGRPVDSNLFGLMIRQQMVAQSITSFVTVDGVRTKCNGPCLESLTWAARTREYVGEIFDYLNGVSREERESFQKALAPKKESTHGSSDTTPSK